jgi:hypothetical protein
MDKKMLAQILSHHDELARLWREVADERCVNQDTWGVYDAVKRGVAHEQMIRSLKMRFIPN